MVKTKVLEKKDFINLLSNSRNKKRREALINIASPSELNSIAELAKNILYSNVRLNKKQLRKLSLIKRELRLIANRNSSSATKKRLLKSGKVQKGGLFPLLPLALSALSSIVGGIAGGIK